MIRSDRFQAFVGEQSIDLTRREFELIELLASAEGRVLEREEIYSRLWGYTMVRGDRSVDVFVRKLRQKLEKASPSWRYIHTHFGIGYRFAAESLEVVDPNEVPSSVPADWDTGDQGKLAGPQQDDELSRPRPLAARPPGRPSSGRSRAPVSSADHAREVGLVPDEQHASVPPAAAASASSASAAVEAAGQRQRGRSAARAASSPQPSAASSAVWRARTFGLKSTASKLAPRRARARPAARACASPRSVRRRSASARVPCGSASA